MRTVEVASEQVSTTAYSPSAQLLGVACANGLSLMVSSSDLRPQGQENQLKSGVNTCLITRKKYLLCGTSNCSYHFQAPEGSARLPWALLLSLGLAVLLMLLMGSKQAEL
jgi:hypothetical protein